MKLNSKILKKSLNSNEEGEEIGKLIEIIIEEHKNSLEELDFLNIITPEEREKIQLI